MSKFSHLCGNERYIACSDDVLAYLPPGFSSSVHAANVSGIALFIYQGSIES